MSYFKQQMLQGEGSLGETVKVLANDFNLFATEPRNLSKRKEYFQTCFNNRKLLNTSFMEMGDKLLHIPFEDFYNNLKLVNEEVFLPQNDLGVFIFCIIYYESRNIRLALGELDSSERKDIFEVIYEVTFEYASQAIVSKEEEFVQYIERLFNALEDDNLVDFMF